MSQLGRKGVRVPLPLPPHPPGAGTFDRVAGFRIGRGRDNRTPQQQPQRQQQQPYGRQAPPPAYGGGQQAAPPYAQQPRPSQQQWPPTNAGQQYGGGPGAPRGGGQQGGGNGEPEYFGDSFQQPDQGPRNDAFANNPGGTQVFSLGEDPYGDSAPYGPSEPPVPSGPRLPWKELLSGIVFRPNATFLQMRDYQVWGTALTVTFLYGLVALFGFGTARDDAMDSAFSTIIPYMLSTAVAFVIGSLILGVVTHTLARQIGGDGAWQPTVGLSMLIMTITDAPRLVFGAFLGGGNGLVQALGWVTWVAAGFLFTSMVSKSHDLPWPKALGASAIQLIAILSLIKLGTL
jgi:hypothetical protein